MESDLQNKGSEQQLSSQQANMFWIVDHDDLCLAPGKLVKQKDENTIYVKCIETDDVYEIEKPFYQVHPSCLQGQDDLLQLGDFNEGALLHNVRVRHGLNKIYTAIGSPILLSINPYQKLKIFTSFTAREYRKFSKALRAGTTTEDKRPPPHLFAIAEDSFQDMMIDNKNQSIIISGESGAGKTEATKIILCYLAKVNTDFTAPQDEDFLTRNQNMAIKKETQVSIESQVLDTNPLLEAFGNAKTFKNNNSSRFGKFIQVNFQSTGVIHSANIKNYLLEKSRVVFLQQAERNFHIFYQIAKTAELQERYKLEGLEDYNYLNQSGVYDVKDVDDEHDLKVTKKCMENIGFTQDQITQSLDIVVGILLLGQVEFEEVEKMGYGQVSSISLDSMGYIEQAAELFGIKPDDLVFALTQQVKTMGKDRITMNLYLQEAVTARDSMSKIVYSKMFQWIVDRINESISKAMKATTKKKNNKFIGLLDIFGFEIFEENSFEQLCINYANEKLQQHFNQHMFTMEQEEYKKENIKWEQIQFTDNQMTIDLIENPKMPSLFKLLEEESMLKGSDQGLLKKYNQILTINKSYKRAGNKFSNETFIVCHYAGEVEYHIEDFLEKNRDTANDTINDCMAGSSKSILNTIFKRIQPVVQQSNAKNNRQSSSLSAKSSGPIGSISGNNLSNQFRSQLNDLILTLKESQPKYVRCIKPNSNFSPQEFNSWDVCKQLKCAGMLEAIRIRKAGYAIRVTQEDFAKRYRNISKNKKALETMSYKKQCEQIIMQVAQDQKNPKSIMNPQFKKWQVGSTKIFMKEEVRTLLEQDLNKAVWGQAVKIQSVHRGNMARKHATKLREALKVMCKGIYAAMIRKRFRGVVYEQIHKINKAKGTIKRFYRWRYRYRQVFREISKRIHKKREEKLRQEQLERQRQMMEQQKQLQAQSGVTPGQNFNVEAGRDQSSLLHFDSENNSPIMKNRNQNQQPFTINPNDVSRASSKFGDTMQKDRFQDNFNMIANFVDDDHENSERLMELEQTLEQTIKDKEDLEQRVKELENELTLRDKKIRELNIRINTRSNRRGDISTSILNGFDESDIIKQGNDVTQIETNNMMQTPGENFDDKIQEIVDEKDQEIHKYKNKVEIQQTEISNLQQNYDQLKEENEQLSKKNKKWVLKLDQEIESNSQKTTQLTQQIKDLQEKNFQLQFDQKQQISEIEKKAYKDQSEEIKRLNDKLKKRSDQIDDLEMHKFNLQEKISREQGKLQKKTEEFTTEIDSLQDQVRQYKEMADEFEMKMIEKDELVQQYEEDCEQLDQELKEANSRLENLGYKNKEVQNNYKEHKQKNAEKSGQLMEAKAEIDKLKQFNEMKQNEIERQNSQIHGLRQNIQELEDENEELKEANIKFKRQINDMSNTNLLNPSSDGNHISELQVQKLTDKLNYTQAKLEQKRQKIKQLDQENNFYHQTTTIFLTIKKVIEKEKKFCYMLSDPSLDLRRRETLEEGIKLCQDKQTTLDKKLKKLLKECKPKEEAKEQENIQQTSYQQPNSSQGQLNQMFASGNYQQDLTNSNMLQAIQENQHEQIETTHMSGQQQQQQYH